MKLRSPLGYPLFAFTLGLGVSSCGDSGTSTPAGPDTTTTTTSTQTTTSTPGTTTGNTSSSAPTPSDDTSSSEAPATEISDDTASAAGSTSFDTESTAPAPVCELPSFSVFNRSDSDASWDDNDFSSVVLDATGCPPGVLVDVTWPHEENWQNGDPSEANHEQTHFTLDSYGPGGDLTNKQVTATIELVDDQRGPNATAGGYLVSVVSVSTFERVTVLEPVIDPDAGAVADAGPEVDAAPQTITETGYSEAESPEEERVLLRHVGDRATVTFALPAKTEAIDSFNPATAFKVNLRFYNVFTPSSTPVTEPGDAGAIEGSDAGFTLVMDAAVDASLGEVVLEPSPYDYLTSRFAITKFTVTDVGAAPTP